MTITPSTSSDKTQGTVVEKAPETFRETIKRMFGTDLLKYRTASILLDLFEKKPDTTDTTDTTDTSRVLPELTIPFRENYVQNRNLMRLFKPTLRTPSGVEITEAQLKRTAEYLEKALGELALTTPLAPTLQNFHIRFSDTSHIAVDRLILCVHDTYETIRATIFQLVEANKELADIYTTINRISGSQKQPKIIKLESDDSDTLSSKEVRETLTQIELALDLLGTEKDLSKMTISIQAGASSSPDDPYIYAIPGQLYIAQNIHTATEPNPDIRIAKALGTNDKAKETTPFDTIKADIKKVLFGCTILTKSEESIPHITIRNNFQRIVMADTRLHEDHKLLSKLNREHIEIRCSGSRSLTEKDPLIARDPIDRMNRIVDIPYDIDTDPAEFAMRLFKDIQNRNFAA